MTFYVIRPNPLITRAEGSLQVHPNPSDITWRHITLNYCCKEKDSSCKGCDLFSGDHRFECEPGYRQSWRLSWIYLAPPQKFLKSTLSEVMPALPHSLQLSVPCSRRSEGGDFGNLFELLEWSGLSSSDISHSFDPPWAHVPMKISVHKRR